MEYQSLSVDELQAQLEQVEQNKAELEKAIGRRWQEAKSELAQQIREMIDERGYDLDEILSLVAGRRRRATAAGKKGGRTYVKYVDPENSGNVYVRGVLPGWMKEKMVAQGYDPSIRADREAFKSNYLRATQD